MPLYYGKSVIPVLFENGSCLVLNKPAGLAVQGGEGVKVSLDSILSNNIAPRPHLVHRLDRDTSGIIVVAKSKEAAAEISLLFRENTPKNPVNRGITRIYLGICSGIPMPGSGEIKICLDVKNRGKAMEKESSTLYETISSGIISDIPFALLELELITGRMHQIRRHLSKIGHPLLGDDKYGNFALNKTLNKKTGLKNLLLHASRLIIPPLPLYAPDGLDITAPLPEYFNFGFNAP